MTTSARFPVSQITAEQQPEDREHSWTNLVVDSPMIELIFFQLHIPTNTQKADGSVMISYNVMRALSSSILMLSVKGW